MLHAPLLPSCYAVRPDPPIHDVHNRRGKVGRHLVVCVGSVPRTTALYVHIAGSSDTLSGTVAYLTRYQCYTVSDVSLFVSPFGGGAQPQDHCIPETPEALPRSTERPRPGGPAWPPDGLPHPWVARSCWSDNAPSRVPASATRTIRRHPLLEISAREPAVSIHDAMAAFQLAAPTRGMSWTRRAPSRSSNSTCVTRACLKSRPHVSRRPSSRSQRRREHRRVVCKLMSNRASDKRKIPPPGGNVSLRSQYRSRRVRPGVPRILSRASSERAEQASSGPCHARASRASEGNRYLCGSR